MEHQFFIDAITLAAFLHDWLFPFVNSLISIYIASGVEVLALWQFEDRKHSETRKLFGRYLDPIVVNDLITQDSDFKRRRFQSRNSHIFS